MAIFTYIYADGYEGSERRCIGEDQIEDVALLWKRTLVMLVDDIAIRIFNLLVNILSISLKSLETLRILPALIQFGCIVWH